MTKNHCIILSFSAWARSSGPYRMATFLNSHNWDCDVIDYIEFWKRDSLEKLLRRKITPDTKWIGLSYTWMIKKSDTVLELVRLIKKINPNILVIIGGQSPYYTNLEADYYIFGYAEYATLKVLDYEFGKGLPPFYTKLFGGKFIDASANYPSHDIKDYSISFRDTDFISNKDLLTISFSRGCKFKCDFCTFPFIGIKEDTSSSEEILYRELMENYQKYGALNYYITDETLNDRTDKLIKIKNVIQRLDFKPNFSGFVRADLLKSHPEHIELLAEARVWGQYYGVETFCHKAGKSIGKGQHPDIVKESVLKSRDYCQKHLGLYRGTISMIAGLPYETIDSMRESQKWLEENWADQCATWYPLQIFHAPSGIGSLSAMGKDFSKYGYRRMETSEYPAKHDKLTVLNGDEIIWENDHTNIFEVHQLIDEEFKFKFKIGGFGLWPLIPYEDSLEKLLKLEFNESELNNTYGKMLLETITNYVVSKYKT